MDKKHKIAVGTESEQKIGYLKEVLDNIGLEYELYPTKVNSQIEEQPLSSEVTKRGSLNRARNALSNKKGVDFAIGIEVGYEKKDGKYEMLAWVSIVDQDNQVSYKSHDMILPEFHQGVLREGKYLSDHVREYHPEETDKAKTILRNIIIYRKPFIENALRHALLIYLAKEDS